MRMLSFVLLACLLGLAGCGTSVGQPSGKITLKTEPMASADVKLVSTTDAKLEFFGRTGEGGQYTVSYREMTGVPVGKYKVTITYYTLRNGKALPAGEAGESLKGDPTKVIKRSVTFDKEITAGSQTIDFDLSQGQAVKDN